MFIFSLSFVGNTQRYTLECSSVPKEGREKKTDTTFVSIRATPAVWKLNFRRPFWIFQEATSSSCNPLEAVQNSRRLLLTWPLIATSSGRGWGGGGGSWLTHVTGRLANQRPGAWGWLDVFYVSISTPTRTIQDCAECCNRQLRFLATTAISRIKSGGKTVQ